MFLESIENLRPLVERARGRTPSAGLAREMTSCLQQGRLFYESADQSDLAIRPLLLFYGTMAYAKALIALQTLNSLSTLRPAHGINDKSRDDSRVDELEVVIGDHAGTFQAFNDAVAPLNRFTYIDGSTTNWASLPFHTASSSDIGGLRLGIRAIWSRIPGLDELYRATYDEPALTESFDLSQTESRSVWDWELRIDDPTPFSNRSELTAIVASLRKRFPALAKWRLVSASQRWDASLIMFGNIPVPENEFAESVLSFCTHENAFAVTGVMEDAPRTPLEDILSPPGGSFSRGGRHSLISPVEGVYVSEYALHYLGMYLLSSLVRYRPQAWVHAITRSVTPENPADDKALALIEAFMSSHCGVISSLFTDVVKLTP